MLDSLYPISSSDLYLGGYCYSRAGSGYYVDGLTFTMGRMYIW